MSETVKVTVNLPAAVVEHLRAIAAANSQSLTAAIRDSIEINKYLMDQEQAHGKILIEMPDGKLRQVVRA